MTSKRRRGYFSPVHPRKLKEWDNDVSISPKNGICVNSQFQGAIYSLYKYMKEEYLHKGSKRPLKEVYERVADALNICTKTVRKYVNVGSSGTPFETRGKKRPRAKPKRDIKEDLKVQIREAVYDLCNQRRYVTVALLLLKLNHHVPFDPKAKNSALLALCQMKSQELGRQYVIDDWVSRNSQHEVVRLPPYHCFYNPIEMHWGIAKTS
ncbi:hypothetical protein HCN44_010980 [Aphidius gifuensis]|uniref:Uncharacterized protein n=1 Tax=Aphidius gifuensis TaxID=684658 RepID=A0A834Y8D5_APHGI|nr:hypothetical protein HCN44_010980 [Aphidius gifuensis]